MSDTECENYREQLERNRVEVVQSLDLDRQFMLSYLRSNNVLDDEDCQLILNAGVSRQQKNSKFLDVIATRGKKAYESFVSALEFEHCSLFELFTGKKANKKSIVTDDGYKWADYDRDYLAKELAKISEQYSSLAYMQGKLQKEKQLLEKKLLETTSELNSARKCQEELRFELSFKEDVIDLESTEQQSFSELITHCQNLSHENAEKSNIIIALQARLLAVNEDRDKRNRDYEELQLKNKTLMQQVKDLTINYDFQRTKSMRLQEKYDKSNDELYRNATQQRELHAVKFNIAKLNEEKEELCKKLDEYRSVVTALNAKLSLVTEQKAAESERRSEISEEYLRIRQQSKIFELERDQGKNMSEYFKEKVERLESEISTAQEQIEFLTGALDNAINERNRVTKEREEVVQYNTHLQKSRDEAIQYQFEVSKKFEARYKDVTSQLDEAKQELKSLMLEHIRSNSVSKEDRKKCQLFEIELENARQKLQQLNTPSNNDCINSTSTITIENITPPKNMEETPDGSKSPGDKSDVSRTESVLDQAIASLDGKSSSLPMEFSLSNRQLSWVYDSLKGYHTSFASILGNSMVFPQFDEDRNSSSDEMNSPKPEKKRYGSNRGLKYKIRSKSVAHTTMDAVRAICPLPLSPRRLRRVSATPPPASGLTD